MEILGKDGEGRLWEEENLVLAECGEMMQGTRRERYDWGGKIVVKLGKWEFDERSESSRKEIND